MRALLLLVLAALLATACSTSPEPPSEPQPEPELESTEAEPIPTPIGVIRVTATKLNIRSGPSTRDTIIGSARQGERLALLERDDGWVRVLLASGETGWVSAQYARDVRNCVPDREFSIREAPMPSFSDRGAKGTVVVEATVGTDGAVTKTAVLQNTTGDESLAVLAEREIRQAIFDPPVRNCLPRAFIYTYRRTF